MISNDCRSITDALTWVVIAKSNVSMKVLRLINMDLLRALEQL